MWVELAQKKYVGTWLGVCSQTVAQIFGFRLTVHLKSHRKNDSGLGSEYAVRISGRYLDFGTAHRDLHRKNASGLGSDHAVGIWGCVPSSYTMQSGVQCSSPDKWLSDLARSMQSVLVG